MARDYELVLMLDPEAPDGRRDEVAGETQKRIESSGELKHADAWGTRKLAFEIRRRTEADYRFYRFEAESDLLEQLDHTLKITDGVLRFRIFKVEAGAPTGAPPPTAQPAGVSARAARAEARRSEPAPGAEEEGETVAEEEGEPTAEPPAEPEPAAQEGEPEPAESPSEAAQPAAEEAAEAGAEDPGDPDNPQAAA